MTYPNEPATVVITREARPAEERRRLQERMARLLSLALLGATVGVALAAPLAL